MNIDPATPSLPTYQLVDPPSISWHARITVAPENAEKFLEVLKPCMDAVRAEKENVFFQVYRDPSKPGKFMFVENWNADLEWLLKVSCSGV
jgi:hypothetical protein